MATFNDEHMIGSIVTWQSKISLAAKMDASLASIQNET